MARKKEGGKKRRKPAKKRPKRSSKDLVNYRRMHALSKRVRVRILAVLCERVASPKEISEELDEGLSQVSYHVKVLRECGLIVEDHKVPRRGAVEHFYRAAAPTLIPPNAWDHLPPILRKSISASILREFVDDASASMEAGVFDHSPGELSWTPLILDALGIEEFGQLARDFLESVLELQASASRRLPKGNGKATDAISATVFLASFLSARCPEDGRKASATKRR
ncbi:MAG TPA: winged helix-turn-helix domain-containing protein [Solirubrobacterales bacterium]|nr:winged helix-turn-helix domain-containing protein [Solirubrobacterales bacterium]